MAVFCNKNVIFEAGATDCFVVEAGLAGKNHAGLKKYVGRGFGPSPVNVGNTTTFTLTGLENGKIYYFAIASWSALDDRITGPLSKEVYARPLQRLGK